MNKKFKILFFFLLLLKNSTSFAECYEECKVYEDVNENSRAACLLACNGKHYKEDYQAVAEAAKKGIQELDAIKKLDDDMASLAKDIARLTEQEKELDKEAKKLQKQADELEHEAQKDKNKAKKPMPNASPASLASSGGAGATPKGSEGIKSEAAPGVEFAEAPQAPDLSGFSADASGGQSSAQNLSAPVQIDPSNIVPSFSAYPTPLGNSQFSPGQVAAGNVPKFQLSGKANALGPIAQAGGSGNSPVPLGPSGGGYAGGGQGGNGSGGKFSGDNSALDGSSLSGIGAGEGEGPAGASGVNVREIAMGSSGGGGEGSSSGGSGGEGDVVASSGSSTKLKAGQIAAIAEKTGEGTPFEEKADQSIMQHVGTAYRNCRKEPKERTFEFRCDGIKNFAERDLASRNPYENTVPAYSTTIQEAFFQ